MPEPLAGGVEPVGGSPIGASGMPVGNQPIEPAAPKTEEPASSDDDSDDVDFEDLKTVPPQFQKIAKKLQSSYTKKMQALTGVEKMKGQESPPEPAAPSNPTLDDAKDKVMQYMQTPEGSALKEVFDSIVKDQLGTLPQEVMQQKVNREVGEVVAKYGEDLINENYEAIETASKASPGVPLDYIVSNVLFEKAKEIGANEYKSKLTRKESFSDSSHGSTSNVISKKDAASFDEAFEAAKSSLGY